MKVPEGHRIDHMGERMELSPWGSLYLCRQEVLLLADLHLGKAAHFRKNGIPVPQDADRSLLERLEGLIDHYRPKRVIVLGDLAHSKRNREWDRFVEWRRSRNSLSFELVRGNHDILGERAYEEGGVKVREPGFELGVFQLFHHPCSSLKKGRYTMAGHLHPAYRLGRHKKERMRLPCFWFARGGAVLPSFNSFAGMAIIPRRPEEALYLLGEGKVYPFAGGEGKDPGISA